MEIDDGFSNKTESELQIMDLENTKQRLLLEISKLSSTLKGITSRCFSYEVTLDKHRMKFIYFLQKKN